MPTVQIAGAVTPAQQQKLRDNLLELSKNFARNTRRLTVGTLLGGVRTKSYPDNAIAGEPVRVVFVADVRLREWHGQPVARDVLVTNQAQQLVAGSAADGTPVTVEVSPSGALAIIARAGFRSDRSSTSYYAVDEIDGTCFDYVVGLRLRVAGDLAPSLLSALNAWRTAHGKPVFASNDKYFLDPQVDVHGVDYFRGYIGLLDGGRFLGSTVGLTCQTVIVKRDWYASDTPDGDWWYGTPSGFSGDRWYGRRREITCT